MKFQILPLKTIAIAALASAAFTTVEAQTKPVKIISGADTLIAANRTWDADTTYFLGGKVYVTNGATLTIQPGTVIVGDTITKGTLLITRGAKIIADGTPLCPIVFTSSKGVGKRRRGDWGGLVILGNATVNTPTGTANIEGLPASALTTYGGGATPNDNDNSGILRYVRVEYAGVALAPNNEINGITFGGVGRGTTVDFIQVTFANDDSFEWFGGTVNCKHLIANQGLDDDFDTDFGYSGKVQFAIGLRSPSVADVSGSNGFESDNDAAGSSNLPQTRAVFSNVTLSAGADSATNALFRNGAQIRRNSHLYIYNSVLMGYPTGLLLDGTATNANVQTDTMVQNNIISATQSSKWVTSNTGNTAATSLLLNNAGNRFYTNNASGVRLSNPYNLNNPNFRPANQSPARTGANFNHIGLTDVFFTKVNFVGSMGPKASDNWATTWVNWNPAQTDYKSVNANCATARAAAVAVTDEIRVEASAPSVAVTPNPSRGNFKVNINGLNGNVTVRVTNMTGAVVYNKSVNVVAKASFVDVNLTNATAGLYFVTVTNGKQSTTQKINIIQ
ncbi:T9SS type A sorting domain-containing protein [Panacibacter sp. DH6]|uniref:T9SS type A sorting domain-containing protein n=1 Tax=Panacibacter microcysteis TaxID=2793269 RepID=A0A931E842_9BACT|nr:T9SS type A sorting domain-containing protein [Panacibacter microcysteis]MBG9375466.1 T9SS type A sorting domain-containing protein [Panacibacter microcysteis]